MKNRVVVENLFEWNVTAELLARLGYTDIGNYPPGINVAVIMINDDHISTWSTERIPSDEMTFSDFIEELECGNNFDNSGDWLSL